MLADRANERQSNAGRSARRWNQVLKLGQRRTPADSKRNGWPAHVPTGKRPCPAILVRGRLLSVKQSADRHLTACSAERYASSHLPRSIPREHWLSELSSEIALRGIANSKVRLVAMRLCLYAVLPCHSPWTSRAVRGMVCAEKRLMHLAGSGQM